MRFSCKTEMFTKRHHGKRPKQRKNAARAAHFPPPEHAFPLAWRRPAPCNTSHRSTQHVTKPDETGRFLRKMALNLPRKSVAQHAKKPQFRGNQMHARIRKNRAFSAGKRCVRAQAIFQQQNPRNIITSAGVQARPRRQRQPLPSLPARAGVYPHATPRRTSAHCSSTLLRKGAKSASEGK